MFLENAIPKINNEALFHHFEQAYNCYQQNVHDNRNFYRITPRIYFSQTQTDSKLNGDRERDFKSI